MRDRSSTNGVRIGPSSLVTLIAALLLAVLAMLCATSANAQSTMAQRQANSLEQCYTVDSYGQRIAAGIDEALHQGSTSMQAVYANIGSIEAKAMNSTADKDVTVTTSLNGESIAFTLTSVDGRILDASVSAKGGSVSIDKWKLTTESGQTENDILWSSASNGK